MRRNMEPVGATSSHNQYTGEWPRWLCPQSRRFVAPKETHCTPLCEYADVKWCWLIVAYIASRSSPHPSSAFPICRRCCHCISAYPLCTFSLSVWFLFSSCWTPRHLHLSFSSHYFYTHITILTHSHTSTCRSLFEHSCCVVHTGNLKNLNIYGLTRTGFGVCFHSCSCFKCSRSGASHGF